jgi:hypothetical protein
MTDREWLAAFAAALDVPPPTDDDVERLLALAAEAAHSSQRTAAPVACWLAACAGRSPEEAVAIANGIGPGPAG